MRLEPGRLFLETFQDAVTTRILQAIGRAYDTAAEHYEPARGNNPRTFGYELYHCAVHELVSEAGDSAGTIRVVSRDPTFRLRVGQFELACHRVGSHASDDIWSSFPDNEGAACRMVEQLWLPGMEPDVEAARKIVIAHLGNPEDGLQALYLCIACRTQRDRIVEWGVAHPVWKDDGAARREAVDPTAPWPTPETISEPLVRRRRRREEQNEREGK